MRVAQKEVVEDLQENNGVAVGQVLRSNVARVFDLLEELFELLGLHRDRERRLNVAARRRGRLLEVLIIVRLVEALCQVCLMLDVLRLQVLGAEQGSGQKPIVPVAPDDNGLINVLEVPCVFWLGDVTKS